MAVEFHAQLLSENAAVPESVSTHDKTLQNTILHPKSHT